MSIESEDNGIVALETHKHHQTITDAEKKAI